VKLEIQRKLSAISNTQPACRKDTIFRSINSRTLRKLKLPKPFETHSPEVSTSEEILAASFGSSGFQRQIGNRLWKLKLPERSGSISLEVRTSGKKSSLMTA
jgi:hypothetical protein